MTHSDVERELRDHYRSLDAGSPGRAASRVADALDQAPAHRWSLGRFIPARALLTAGATVAVVAALTVALLPLWHGSFESTGASGQSPTPQTSASAPASPSAGASRYAQATPGTVALRIADSTAWRVQTTDLDETLVARIHSGSAATLTFDAYPGVSVPGVVREIGAYGETNQGDIVYRVVVEPTAALPAGVRWRMTASVTISTK